VLSVGGSGKVFFKKGSFRSSKPKSGFHHICEVCKSWMFCKLINGVCICESCYVKNGGSGAYWQKSECNIYA